MTTYPAIPTLPPARRDETTIGYGLRAFAFLLTERVSAAVLDSDTLEHAAAASQLLVAQPDLLDTTRERYRDVRHDVFTTLARRQRDAADLAHLADIRARLAARQQPTNDDGKRPGGRVPRPVVPTPRPPAAGAVTPSGRPVPTPDVIRQRLAAARAFAQSGGAL